MEEVSIRDEFIKLAQVLKLSGTVGQGSDARAIIEEGLVKVNGETATQRGKKVRPGDVVEVEGMGSFKVVGQE